MPLLQDLAGAILRYTERCSGPGPYVTAIDRMTIVRSDAPNAPNLMVARPALCVVAQGAKRASFGDRRLHYTAGQALLVGVEAPAFGHVIEASAAAPCLVLAFELDLDVMRDVAADLDPPPVVESDPCSGVLVTNFDGPLADCAMRLMRLLDTPAAIPALQPLVMREICFWLLTGPHGAQVARLTLPNSPSQPVLAAVRHLRSRFKDPLRIEELAAVARMSSSSFHRHFRVLTSMSPLQFQKQLRLAEARRLMTACGRNVETAAFEVGYESPSQFSREYARMFGAPPKRHAKILQDAFRRSGVETGDAALDLSSATYAARKELLFAREVP